MKCPICKKIIPDESLKCPYCKSRTGLVCPNCNTINSVLDLTCKTCGQDILKICKHCNSVNFLDAEKCRKCGFPFDTPDEQQLNANTFELPPQVVPQLTAKNILEKGILSNDKKIFSISGDKGSGKTVVLKTLMDTLRQHEFSWIYGKCTPITQLTPGGVIQDILLNIFNLPDFCIDNPQFRKDFCKFFSNEFPFLNTHETELLMNFLYPTKLGTFEELFKAKSKSFELLFKLFENILEDRKYVITLDNFDFIDGFSYEFISKLIQRKSIYDNLKLLLVYNEQKSAKGYFAFPDNPYIDVAIAPLEPSQVNQVVSQKKENWEDFLALNPSEMSELLEKSHGNPSFIEQTLCLRFDCQIADKPFNIPDNFADILTYRLEILKLLNPIAHKILVGSAVIGEKININLVKEIFDLDSEKFADILAYLEQMSFISPLNDIFYEFKSLTLWETIIKTSKNTENFESINEKVFDAIKDFIMNSNAIPAIIAQNLKNTKLSLDIWTKNTRLAAYAGDVNLYAISQKQCLALINELDDSETLNIRFNIAERLGKLLSDANPQEAMEYLPDAISNAQSVGNTPKEIELLAYLSHCCRITGNYFGEVECVDSVLDKTPVEKTLEIALIKTAKLNALLSIGNCGQIVNLVDTEIMPVFDNVLSKKYRRRDIPIELVYESWLKTYLVLANALVMQGDDRSFEILTILFDIIDRHKLEDELFICNCKLTLAFANTMKGDVKTSKKILEEVMKNHKDDSMDQDAVLRWNLINIVNNFFIKNYDGMQEDLFQVVTYANNHGDNFTKNILKTLLGKLFKDKEQSKHAMEIYNEQITYFAKEKMAIGALLTWYLIADTALITDGAQTSLEIASQALEVAQSPKINNYFFAVLLKSVIAKAFITLSDYEAAKMNIESALVLTQRYHMDDLTSRILLLYGKYYQEVGLIKSPQQGEYLNAASKLFEKASEVVKETKNKYVHKEIEKAKQVLRSFCRINNIKIK